MTIWTFSTFLSSPLSRSVFMSLCLWVCRWYNCTQVSLCENNYEYAGKNWTLGHFYVLSPYFLSNIFVFWDYIVVISFPPPVPSFKLSLSNSWSLCSLIVVTYIFVCMYVYIYCLCINRVSLCILGMPEIRDGIFYWTENLPIRYTKWPASPWYLSVSTTHLCQ